MAEAPCSNWTSKGQTLIPKMLLNHIQFQPLKTAEDNSIGQQRPPSSCIFPCSRAGTEAVADVNQNLGKDPPKSTFWAPSRISVPLPSLSANSGSNSPVGQSQSLLGQQQELI